MCERPSRLWRKIEDEQSSGRPDAPAFFSDHSGTPCSKCWTQFTPSLAHCTKKNPTENKFSKKPRNKRRKTQKTYTTTEDGNASPSPALLNVRIPCPWLETTLLAPVTRTRKVYKKSARKVYTKSARKCTRKVLLLPRLHKLPLVPPCPWASPTERCLGHVNCQHLRAKARPALRFDTPVFCCTLVPAARRQSHHQGQAAGRLPRLSKQALIADRTDAYGCLRSTACTKLYTT